MSLWPRRALVPLGLLLATATSAFGWGNEGHQAIGEVAQSRLTEKAHAALARILVGGTTMVLPPGKLAAVSTWPDEIRAFKTRGSVPAGWHREEIAEAEKFNTDHRANAVWHFVNIPLGASGYDDAAAAAFRSPDDIVAAINRAIRVLESASPPASYSKAQAVRWLVHLVADLHQPLHVASGYYETTAAALRAPRLIRDPHDAAKSGIVSDRGGTRLLFNAEGDNLHSVWDGCLVQRASGERCDGGPKTYTPLAHRLKVLGKEPAAAAFAASGDHRQWAAEWATDTLKVAVAADVFGVKLTGAHVPGGEAFLQARIAAPRMHAYANAHATAARTQLLKASIRLAELLNAIDWK